jgi:IclR family transcriptional regulator, KDG regulon repressor
VSTTVIKALKVIEALAGSGGAMGITEVSRAIDMNKSAVQRILGVLTTRGYVEQLEGTRKYQLSLMFWELGTKVIENHPQRRLVHPILRYAAQSTGLTAFLTCYSHPFVIYLDKVEGANGRAHSTEPGNRIPLHRTAAGKAVLAYLPDALVKQLPKASSNWPGASRFGPVDMTQLKGELVRIRKNRFAVSEGGLKLGVNSIAAPIWAGAVTPFGSIALTADEKNLPRQQFGPLSEQLLTICREATIALGGAQFQEQAERAVHA